MPASALRKTAGIFFYFLLISGLFFFNGFYDSYQLTKAYGFALILFACLTFFLLSKNFPVLSPYLIPAGLYFAYILLRSLDSSNNPQLFYTLTLLSPAAMLAGLSFPPDRKKFLIFTGILCAASSIYGIVQFYTGYVRPYSFFGNPIFFAEYLSMNLPIAVLSLFFFKKFRTLLYLNILLLLAAIFISGSRGAFISGGISILAVIFFLKKNRLLPCAPSPGRAGYFAAITSVFLIILLTLPGFFNVLNFNLSRARALFSLSSPEIKSRVLMLKSAVNIAGINPAFGSGSGGFRYNYQAAQSQLLKNNSTFDFINTSYAHNDYFQLTAEFGMIGLLLFLLSFFFIIMLFDKYSGKLDNESYIFALAMLGSAAAVMIEAFFNFPLFIMPVSFLFWLYLGIMAATCLPNNTKPLNTAAYVVAIICVIAVFSVLVSGSKSLASNFYLKQGTLELQKSTNYERDYLIRASNLDPKNFYPWFYLGVSYGNNPETYSADSVKNYTRALKVQPNSCDVMFNIGSLLRSAGNYNEAETYYLKALDLYPYFGMARAELGRLYLDLNRNNEAAEQFTLAHEYDPGAVEASVLNKVMLFTEATWENKKPGE